MNLRLRHKVTGLALVSALVPVVALLALLVWQERDIRGVVQGQFQDSVHNELNVELRGLYGMLETSNGLLQARVDATLAVAHDLLDRAGAVSFGPETATWDAVNQATKETQLVVAPQFKLGGRWIGQNADLKVPTSVVDQLKQLAGGTCTIFQRLNEAGDMLRVATNVETLDGKRAIGTFIPSTSPVVQSVLGGQTFRGPAYVVNAWYVSDYEPLKDAAGRVTGMLYVGVKQEADSTLREAISKTKIGEHGYVWLAYGKNTSKLPPFILHGGGLPPASMTLETVKDLDGKPVFPPLLAEVMKTPGEVKFLTGAWRADKDPNDPAYNQKYAAAIYYAPWDWVVGLTAYDLDSSAVRDKMRGEFNQLRLVIFVGALVMLVIIGVVAAYFGRRIAGPITQATGIARQIADGDLTVDVAGQGNDETGQLLAANRDMVVSLNSLLTQVKRSSIQLISTANEISATSKVQESTVQDFGASTSQIAAAVKEISATAQELVGTMAGVSDMAQNTAARRP